MQVSNNLNERIADGLAQQIDDLINKDPELTQGEILRACMMVMCGVLASIECRDCRALVTQSVKKEFQRAVMFALTQAIAAKPNNSAPHVH